MHFDKFCLMYIQKPLENKLLKMRLKSGYQIRSTKLIADIQLAIFEIVFFFADTSFLNFYSLKFQVLNKFLIYSEQFYV